MKNWRDIKIESDKDIIITRKNKVIYGDNIKLNAKTITYALIKELTEDEYISLYVNLLKIFKSLDVEGTEFQPTDLVFYPLNIEAIKEEQKFLVSANKIAYVYLKEIDDKIIEILEVLGIEISREEIEQNEK
jgi:hypothetical protein